jgi:transcriptional regulator GlxA family with amidase domain
MRRAPLERRRPDLRAAQVLHYGDDPSSFRSGGPDAVIDLGMRLVSAMREIEAEDVDTTLDQLAQRLW